MALPKEEGSSTGHCLNVDGEAPQFDVHRGVVTVSLVDDELGLVLEVADVTEDGVVVCSHGPCHLLCVSIGVEDRMAFSRVMVYVGVAVLHEEERRAYWNVEAFCDEVPVHHLSNGNEEV